MLPGLMTWEGPGDSHFAAENVKANSVIGEGPRFTNKGNCIFFKMLRMKFAKKLVL